MSEDGRLIALLRGVNVGGKKVVPMAELRAMFTRAGFTDARTVLQSGNVVFPADGRCAEIERLLAAEARKHLGLDTTFFVRTAGEWQALIEANPFPGEARRDPGRLVVQFTRDAPPPRAEADLRAAITGRELVCVVGRQAYIVFPDGIGRSRLTTALIERHLGTATGRNWKTVLRLGAMVTE